MPDEMDSSASFPSPISSKQSTNSPLPLSAPAKSSSIVTQTPDKKPVEFPNRVRNRRKALSIKEIRQVALGNQHELCPNSSDSTSKSVVRKISSWPDTSASPIPVSRKVIDNSSAAIPASFEILGQFFDGLDSSTRLLKMKGTRSSFSNICPQIESLTDRRFTHRHLAQLKYIFPDVIEIKKILVFDEVSSCMKPDLHVTLNVDGIEWDENSKFGSKNTQLRKIFRSKLAEFCKTHPEEEEIPEEMLPEPFNRAQKSLVSDCRISENSLSSMEADVDSFEDMKPAMASHFSLSFQRRLSRKAADAENIKQTSLSVHQPSHFTPPQGKALPVLGSGSSCYLPATPSKMKGLVDVIECQFTPLKDAFTPAKQAVTPEQFNSSTPTMRPPKRCYLSPEENSRCSSRKKIRHPLAFDALAMDEACAPRNASDDDSDIVSGDLLKSIREKELKLKEEQDPVICNARRRKQNISRLPKLFNTVRFLFQSIKRTVLTKEEFLHKLISGHPEIVDRKEVEEQLSLLLELVPEWISEKLASSGDLLVCINQNSSVEILRSRLEVAQ